MKAVQNKYQHKLTCICTAPMASLGLRPTQSLLRFGRRAGLTEGFGQSRSCVRLALHRGQFLGAGVAAVLGQVERLLSGHVVVVDLVVALAELTQLVVEVGGVLGDLRGRLERRGDLLLGGAFLDGIGNLLQVLAGGLEGLQRHFSSLVRQSSTLGLGSNLRLGGDELLAEVFLAGIRKLSGEAGRLLLQLLEVGIGLGQIALGDLSTGLHGSDVVELGLDFGVELGQVVAVAVGLGRGGVVRLGIPDLQGGAELGGNGGADGDENNYSDDDFDDHGIYLSS